MRTVSMWDLWKKSKFYDNGNEGARTWRACDWAGHKVILVGPSCRVNCKEHGVVTCCFPWARHGSRFTRKFEEQTAWMAVNCSRVAVATFMRISWNTVGPIIERVEKDLDINPSCTLEYDIDMYNSYKAMNAMAKGIFEIMKKDMSVFLGKELEIVEMCSDKPKSIEALEPVKKSASIQGLN